MVSQSDTDAEAEAEADAEADLRRQEDHEAALMDRLINIVAAVLAGSGALYGAGRIFFGEWGYGLAIVVGSGLSLFVLFPVLWILAVIVHESIRRRRRAKLKK